MSIRSENFIYPCFQSIIRSFLVFFFPPVGAKQNEIWIITLALGKTAMPIKLFQPLNTAVTQSSNNSQ